PGLRCPATRQCAHLVLHAFPTRRSSDLSLAEPFGAGAVARVLETAGLLAALRAADPAAAGQDVAVAGHQPLPSGRPCALASATRDRKSTRLNSSHVKISYAVFYLKKKTH